MVIAFDLETTGLDRFADKIIEIAMIKFDEQTFKILETYSCFVNPEVKIPETISNITSIFDDDVKDAPKISEIRDEIKAFI
jgi:DNA polymerase-3 subunit alpha (Gram-positive type)